MAYTVRVLEPSILVKKQPNVLSRDVFLVAIQELDSEHEEFVVYGQHLARHCPYILWRHQDEATARMIFNHCVDGYLPIGYSITNEDFLFMLFLVMRRPSAVFENIPKSYVVEGVESDDDRGMVVREISQMGYDEAEQGQSWMGRLQ